MRVGQLQTMSNKNSTLLKDWTKFITGKSSTAILYRDYQILKTKARKLKHKESYNRWEEVILKDIPRSYPNSRWISSKTNQNILKEILKCWLVYSKIGYIQSMLFYLVPFVYVFQKTPHLAFWAFVHTFNNISGFIRETLDPEYAVHALNEDSNDVLYRFSVCYFEKHDHIFTEMQKHVFYIIINYNIHAKCAVGYLATCLKQATVVMDYLIPHIHDKNKFVEALKSISFSSMLCLVFGKSPKELSDKLLMDLNVKMKFTDDSLFAIIDSANSCKEIFKYKNT